MFGRGSDKHFALAPVAAAIVVLVLSIGLVACGGDDEGSSTGSGSGSNKAADSSDKAGSAGNGGGGASETASNQTSDGSAEGSESAAAETPAAAEDPYSRFGEPADEANESAIVEAVVTYTNAAVSGDGEAGCSVISNSVRNELETVLGSTPQTEGFDCAQLLSISFEGYPDELRQELDQLKLIDVRVDGSEASAIFELPEAGPSVYPLALQSGRWAVDSLGAEPV